MPQERWVLLCKQASSGHDPQKLVELISEINDLIDKKLSRRGEKYGEKYGADGPISRGAAA
jgi:hypothetical protein